MTQRPHPPNVHQWQWWWYWLHSSLPGAPSSVGVECISTAHLSAEMLRPLGFVRHCTVVPRTIQPSCWPARLSGTTLVPFFRLSTVGSRTFSISGLWIWNALPEDVSVPSLSTFRRWLKTSSFSNRFCRVQIDYVISRYRSRIRQPWDIASPWDRRVLCIGLERYRQCCRYPIPQYSRPLIPILDTDADTGSDLILATVDSQQSSYLGCISPPGPFPSL